MSLLKKETLSNDSQKRRFRHFFFRKKIEDQNTVFGKKTSWKDVRVVEGVDLERLYDRKIVEGSNPSLSVKIVSWYTGSKI